MANSSDLTGVRAVAALTDLDFASIAAGVPAGGRPVVLELALPARRIRVLLDPTGAGKGLTGTFHSANREKRMASAVSAARGVDLSGARSATCGVNSTKRSCSWIYRCATRPGRSPRSSPRRRD